MSYVYASGADGFFNHGANGSNHKRKPCSSASPGRVVIEPSQSWASWKNQISGHYNRQLCDCRFVGYSPEAGGAFCPHRVRIAPTRNDAACKNDLALRRDLYRATRMSDGRRYGIDGHYSYMDYSGRRIQGLPATGVPYTKGWWHDEEPAHTYPAMDVPTPHCSHGQTPPPAGTPRAPPMPQSTR